MGLRDAVRTVSTGSPVAGSVVQDAIDPLIAVFDRAICGCDERGIIQRRSLPSAEVLAAMWPHEGHLIHPALLMYLESQDVVNLKTGAIKWDLEKGQRRV